MRACAYVCIYDTYSKEMKSIMRSRAPRDESLYVFQIFANNSRGVRSVGGGEGVENTAKSARGKMRT